MSIKANEIKGSRRLVLIDIENLAGAPRVTSEQAMRVQMGLRRVCPLDPRDIVYVGGHTGNAFACGLVAKMTYGSMCLRRGRDGAEIALCEQAMQVPDSAYDSNLYPIRECVIGSGDHYFVDFARRTVARGLHVTVISRWGSLSVELALAASRVTYLDYPGLEIGKAA